MSHVFISYCRADAGFARLLVDKLGTASLDAWWDPNLGAGDEWRAEIDDQIKAAFAVVAIISPASKNSAYVTYEWALALGLGIPVVPVTYKLSLAGLPTQLSVRQGLDFSNESQRPWYELVTALKNYMDAQRPHTIHVSRDAPPVVREAARKLDSMDAREREAALASLEQMTDPNVVEVLAEAILHPIREVRFAAAIELGKRGDVRALPALLEAARHDFRRIEPWMIARIGAAAVDELIAALRKDYSPDVQGLITGALGQIGGSSAVAVLIERLRDPNLDWYQRRKAASALGAAGDAAAMPALLEAMSAPEADVRRSVAVALPRCGGASVISKLIDLLRDPDNDVRHNAVNGLIDVGDSTAVAALVSALTDTNPQVCYNSARALQKIGDPMAIPGLIRAAATKGNNMIIEGAITSFGTAVLPELRRVLQDKDPRMRATAIEFIASLGDESDVPGFLEALRDESAMVRERAIRALKKEWQTPDMVQRVIERLQDDHEGVCIRAAYKLGNLRDATAVSHLIQCLQDDGLAEAAAEALEEIGTRPAKNAVRAWRKQNGMK